MSEVSSRLLQIARAQAEARQSESDDRRYEQVAEFFRRITRLDRRSFGPELARFQNIDRPAPPRRMTLGGRAKALFFRIANPVIGRVLNAASLASPFRAAYELSIQLHQQQLESESRILAEIAGINARLELLESEIRSRR